MIAAWDRFWFAEGRTLNLGLFRLLLACSLAIEVSDSLYYSVFALDGGFHLPYFDAIPTVSEPTYRLIHTLQYPLIVFVGLGLFARGACGALLLLQGYVFFADRLNFRNHAYLFLLLLLLLMLAPCSDALSARALARAAWRRLSWTAALGGSRRPLTFQRLLQVQVCIVYAYAGLSKLYPAYLRGEVLTAQLVGVLPERLLHPAAMAGASVFTVAVELTLPLALWWSRARPLAILLGVVLHSTIAVGLEIYAFSLAMMASYLLFLDTEELPWSGAGDA